MSPADIATLNDSLLALLKLVLAIVVPVLTLVVRQWLAAHTAKLQAASDAVLWQTASITAHEIVRGIDQEYGPGQGPAKKGAAVEALQAALPWLPAGVASLLVEAGVLTLHEAATWNTPAAPAPAPVVLATAAGVVTQVPS